ncbi:hypothetical protein ACFX19_017326 [Malus domestica]
MACRHMGKVIYGAKHLMAKRNGALHLNAQLYHSSEEFHEQPFPPESKLVNISDGSIIIDNRVEHRMHTFKSPSRVFIGAPLVRRALKNNVAALSEGRTQLFTLLLYYLYGHVRYIELDVRGGVYSCGSENDSCLCMERIVTSDVEDVVWSRMRQLDRALGLFKFVWETAGVKGALQLQAHIWCVGAEARVVTYTGNSFFVHGFHV